MAKISYVLCTVLPLAWSSFALAASPTSPEAPPPAAAGEHHHGDFAAWHKEMCGEHYAETAAHLAYLQARLNLSEQQAGPFGKWRQAVLEQSSKERTSCLEAAPKGNARPTFLERESHLEKILTAKLQSLQTTRPALEAAYETLSPEQKIIFDREFRHGEDQPGHHGPHDGHFGGMRHDGMAGHGDMPQAK